ncbi:carboxylic ester hydrolase [Elysia marginata]|uniref:Carboxylic ester hydrolase n=1 Tax=Elysia marginata TaxID=1093978 RepID=A0AAV4JZ81_9GAST|nr:carboxylic ester hydrolase [Elysia marginata]
MLIQGAFHLLWFSVAVAVVTAENTVIVDTSFGKLQGVETTARNGHKFLSFTGIPYAKPPVGALRFAKPEPHPPIDGVFDATKPAEFCPHPTALLYIDDMPAGQEDCLVLNVYVKQLEHGPQGSAPASATRKSTTTTTATRKSGTGPIGDKKKVVVWVHGGGFMAGGATDYPAGTFVATQDVILVGINYRIGILGFLSTENEASVGNYGMWDQVMALKWVKDNIAAFGGDPDDITIAGESAGGASVGFLSIVPSTSGLFTKVYPMSGTGTSVFATAVDAQDHAVDVAKSTGCLDKELTLDRKLTLEESEKMMSCLRDVPVEEFQKLAPFSIDRAQFVPRVDGDFLPLHPSKLLQDDNYLDSIGFFDRTYLFSVTNSEKAVMQGAVDATEAGINGQEGVSGADKTAQIGKLYNNTHRFYLGSRLNIASPPGDLVDKAVSWYSRRLTENQLSTLVSDLTFIIPTYDYLNALARSKTTDAYFLYFNHYPGYMQGKHRGIVHAADLLYWFDIELEKWEKLLHVGIDGEFDEEDLNLQMMFTDLVGQFMKTGNPWHGLQEVLPGGWPSFDLRGNHYLDFGPKPVVRRHLEKDKKDFWLTTVPEWASSYKSGVPKSFY